MEHKISRSESDLNDEMVLLADIKEEDDIENYKQDDEQPSKEIDITTMGKLTQKLETFTIPSGH